MVWGVAPALGVAARLDEEAGLRNGPDALVGMHKEKEEGKRRGKRHKAGSAFCRRSRKTAAKDVPFLMLTSIKLGRFTFIV